MAKNKKNPLRWEKADNYTQVKRDAQELADKSGLHLRIVEDFFGQYASTLVPAPKLQCGRDLEGELISPTRIRA